MEKIEEMRYLNECLKNARITELFMQDRNISIQQLLGTKITINPIKIKNIHLFRNKKCFKEIFSYNGIAFQTKKEVNVFLKEHGYEIIEVDGNSSYVSHTNEFGNFVIGKNKTKKLIRELSYNSK